MSRHVLCGVCGRDNPESLVFCQDCGARIGRRVVPPTPAVGMSSPGSGAAKDDDPPSSAFDKTALAPPSGRPSAPGAGAWQSDASGVQAPSTTCTACGTVAPVGTKYCSSCGRALDAPMPPPASTTDETPALAPRPAAPFGVDPGSPIAPAPVVSVGTDESPVARAPTPAKADPPAESGPDEVECGHCGRKSDGADAFCRYCGKPRRTAPGPREAPAAKERAPSPAPAPAVPIATPSAQTELPATTRRAPEPVDGARALLVHVAKDGSDGQSYPVIDAIDIGRTAGDVQIPSDRCLDPRHLRIRWTGAAFSAVDLESVNGVYVRLRSSTEGRGPGTPLAHQDLILLGQQVVRFEVVKGAEQGFGIVEERGVALFGSPQAPRYARLVGQTVEGIARDIIHLAKNETTLGREGCDIVFPEDPFLSRRHARILRQTPDGSFIVEDLGSSNGTFLRIRGETNLEFGDEIRIGQQLFRLAEPTSMRPRT